MTEVIFSGKVMKWGNSLAIIIPYKIRKDYNIRRGQLVKVTIILEDDNIIEEIG